MSDHLLCYVQSVRDARRSKIRFTGNGGVSISACYLLLILYNSNSFNDNIVFLR